jgi:hypothetical protein
MRLFDEKSKNFIDRTGEPLSKEMFLGMLMKKLIQNQNYKPLHPDNYPVTVQEPRNASRELELIRAYMDEQMRIANQSIDDEVARKRKK